MQEGARASRRITTGEAELAQQFMRPRRQVIDKVRIARLKAGELLWRPEQIGTVGVAIVELGQAVLQVRIVAPRMFGRFVEIMDRSGPWRSIIWNSR